MEFNSANCLVTKINPGWGNCVPSIGELLFDVAVPYGTRFTQADIADMLGTLTTLLSNDDPLARGALLGRWQSVEDSSVEEIRESLDRGVDITLYDGAYIWIRRQVKGGLCAHQALRALNGGSEQFQFLSVYRAREKNIKYYVAGVGVPNATTGATEMRGVNYDDIWSPKRGIAAATAGEMYKLRTVCGDVEQFNEDMVFVPVTFEVEDLPRVQDIELRVTKVTDHTYDIEAFTKCGKQNISDLNGNLAAAGAFKVYAAGTTAEVTINTVTLQPTKAYRIVVDDTDTDYTGATELDFTMAAVSVLAGSPYNFKYYEANKVEGVTK